MTKENTGAVSTANALKMAIELMERFLEHDGISSSDYIDVCEACKEALASNCEALEQPALDWMIKEKKLEHLKDQPAQEPVASLIFYADGSCEALSHDGTISRLMTKEQRKSHVPIDLYIHPAPSWQGLNDDEIKSLCNVVTEIESLDVIEYYWHEMKDVVNAIEFALKVKNEK